MAIHTLQDPMGASQRKQTHAVSKLRGLPKLLAMAIATVGLTPQMNIIFFVTHDTLFTQSPQTAVIFVAFKTLQRIVHSRERKVLVKVFGLLPLLLKMALRTVCSKSPLMRIFVAAPAL